MCQRPARATLIKNAFAGPRIGTLRYGTVRIKNCNAVEYKKHRLVDERGWEWLGWRVVSGAKTLNYSGCEFSQFRG